MAFERSEELNRALRKEPEVRSEAVARGKELVSSLQYPPTELIDGISNLLARHLVDSQLSDQ